MSCARNGYETALDITAYAAQIAAQLGAHIIKVKLPSAHIEQPAAQKVYEQYAIQRASLADQVAHVVQIAFAGHRIVIFSPGGPGRKVTRRFSRKSGDPRRRGIWLDHRPQHVPAQQDRGVETAGYACGHISRGGIAGPAGCLPSFRAGACPALHYSLTVRGPSLCAGGMPADRCDWKVRVDDLCFTRRRHPLRTPARPPRGSV